MSKALYQPKGRAQEYSPWAVNFYTGCSNDCDYCYCKRGVLSHIWSPEPKLKKGFKDEYHALDVFEKELKRNLEAVRKTGILFSFTTDPMLPETHILTLSAAKVANMEGIPVKILTKCANKAVYGIVKGTEFSDRSLIAFGFTLTGADGLEPNASTNAERIEAMKRLHDMGFKTFASIEPVIASVESQRMMAETMDFCDLYKVGLISGAKKDYYDRLKMKAFYTWLTLKSNDTKIYLKDSFLKYLGLDRDRLPKTFVNSDYNIFKQ